MSVNEAVAKINAEIEEKNNAHVRVVGQFLKDYLKIDASAADKITAEEKTITGSVKAMRDEAAKNKVDGVAVLTEAEGFEIVLKYYGVEAVDPQQEPEEEFGTELADFL